VVVVNWEKEDAEYMGLMKLDILGLSTLTVLNETKRLVKKNYNKEIVFENISLDDHAVIEEINQCHNIGVFQMGTYATDQLIPEVGIDSFKDIIAVQALVRPGPSDSGMTAEYIERKRRRTWERLHESYEEVTKDTYGIIVFQEQIMAVIKEVAGLSYTIADKIRKIIGKKRDVSEFKKYKQMFIDGCKSQKTLNRRQALEFWKALEKHAHYSFNMAHSTSYSMICYWTAWAKYYYPTEFICASLAYGTGTNKESLVEEAYRMGLTVCLPKVGKSKADQWVAEKRRLYIPFNEVKGIGEVTAKEIIEKEQEKSKQGFFNFLSDDQKTNIDVKGKVKKILERMKSFSEEDVTEEEKKDLQEFFEFRILYDKQNMYPNLTNLMGRALTEEEIYDLIEGKEIERITNIKKNKIILEGQIGKRDRKLLSCERCELRKECNSPVLPSRGIYNVGIYGEAPGKNEDLKGKGFIGRAGDLLWKVLGNYGLKRNLFFVSNIVKCYPSKTKTPKEEHIHICKKWFEKEIEQNELRVILGFGNTCVRALTDRKGGITKLNGTTEWIEKYGLWVCWCVHPAYVLRNMKDNLVDFETGVENFVNVLKQLRGFSEILF
jgi:DNA polymerase-3 subunit alpha